MKVKLKDAKAKLFTVELLDSEAPEAEAIENLTKWAELGTTKATPPFKVVKTK